MRYLLAAPFFFSGIICGAIKIWFRAGLIAGEDYARDRGKHD